MKTRNPTTRRWRSLGELENSPDFQEFVQREFPVAASEFPTGVSRRRWLQLMGASFALASAAGCRWETEQIAAFSERPEGRVPGEREKFATAIELAGGVRHLLVTCVDGRPIKAEGNPDHPASGGATDIYAQAAILDLYDPDRSGEIVERAVQDTFVRDWDAFDTWAQNHFVELRAKEGRGLAVLIEPTASPALHGQLRQLRESLPLSRLFEHASLPRDNESRGAEMAFGQPLRPVFELHRARVIVCLDEDLIGRHPNALRHARDYASRRDPNGDWMNRLYAVESQFSITGAAADHRVPVRSSEIGKFLVAIEEAVDKFEAGQDNPEATLPGEAAIEERIALAIASDLVRHRGASVIAVGMHQPPELHARAARLNDRLGNLGTTVRYGMDPAFHGKTANLQSLTKAMQAGEVDTLLVLGGNPVFDAPADMPFTKALANVPHSIRLGIYNDETSQLCQWHLPESHPLEQWGCFRGGDAIISVSQPLIESLRNGRSPLELLARLTGDRRTPLEIARAAVDEAMDGSLTDKQWRRIVHEGFVSAALGPSLTDLPRSVARDLPEINVVETPLELVFKHSDCVHDGR